MFFLSSWWWASQQLRQSEMFLPSRLLQVGQQTQQRFILHFQQFWAFSRLNGRWKLAARLLLHLFCCRQNSFQSCFITKISNGASCDFSDLLNCSGKLATRLKDMVTASNWLILSDKLEAGCSRPSSDCLMYILLSMISQICSGLSAGGLFQLLPISASTSCTFRVEISLNLLIKFWNSIFLESRARSCFLSSVRSSTSPTAFLTFSASTQISCQFLRFIFLQTIFESREMSSISKYISSVLVLVVLHPNTKIRKLWLLRGRLTILMVSLLSAVVISNLPRLGFSYSCSFLSFLFHPNMRRAM